MILTSTKTIFATHGADVINKGAVAINKGIILSVGPVDNIINKYPGHCVYQLDNAVLMPGLVNLHTHLELPPLFNSIRAKTYSGWVLNLISAKKDLMQKDYMAAARKNVETLIRTGTTTTGEICTHDVSPALLKRRGVRAVVYKEVISMPGHFTNSRLLHYVKAPLSQPFSSAGTRRLVQSGFSPHTPYTVSEPALRAISQLSNNKNIRLAMHVAESKDEIRLLQRKKSRLEKLYQLAKWDPAWAPTGRSSFEYLERIGFLSPNLLVVHAIHVTDNDIDLIKRSGVSVAHCPRSNKELGVGRMPLKKYLDAGVTVGLGTDSLASVPTLIMWDEMRYAYRIHRRDGISAEDIIRIATIGGAKALGLDAEIGSLEPGKKADIIAVPLPKKNTGDLYSDLLRETKSCIMSVVNGKILFKEG